MNEHNLFYVKEDVIQWMTQVYSEKKKNENTCNGFRTNKLPTRALDALPLSYRRLVSWQARPWHKVRSGKLWAYCKYEIVDMCRLCRWWWKWRWKILNLRGHLSKEKGHSVHRPSRRWDVLSLSYTTLVGTLAVKLGLWRETFWIRRG